MVYNLVTLWGCTVKTYISFKIDNSLTIISLNCQGLNNNQKRRDVFHYLRNKKYSIYFLQDTHFQEKMETQVLSEWGYTGFFSSYASNARGVAILFNNNFEFKVKIAHRDTDGNCVMVLAQIKQNDFLFVNVYGPNRDDPEFYKDLNEKIKEFRVDRVIIGGDFNLVLDPSRDYCNYKNINNPKAREEVENMINDIELNDIWRDLNEDCRRYTWRRSTPFQQARLDFFLISDHVVTYVDDVDIAYGYRSDHSMILLKLKFGERSRCQSFWKFNTSLLRDKSYLDEINEEIRKVKDEYVVTPYARENLENIPLNELQLTIPDDLFLDVLLMKLRSKTISYASMKKRKTNEEENKLEEDIRKLENKQNKTDEDNKVLCSKKEQLQIIREKRIQGVLLRSRARWIAEGEKATKYFCSLEKRHYTSKNICRLTDDKGNDITDQREILKEVETFYKDLYTKSNVDECEVNELVQDIPKLDFEKAQELEGEILLEEASVALKNMKNDKSPGTDGFSAEFFKCFWSRIGVFVVRALNDGYRKGKLSNTQRQGVITCIPKGDKPRNFIKNWRPISLLNVVYKIGSACIANRIKTVLPQLVHEDQTGFIKNRYIGDNIRLIYDIIAYLEENRHPGLLLNIDFKKAFDSIEWDFMFKVLDAFNFGEGICRWVKTFYCETKSCVAVNGQISNWFMIERGCRQGDPLSPYLFILCAEILALMIRENKAIQGITINNVEHKISQYADDTEFLLKGDQRSFETCIKLLDKFGSKSGLLINYEKTSAIWLGSCKNSMVRYMSHLKIEWNLEKFKILGIWFTNDLKNCCDINYQEKLADVKHLFKVWVKRQLTPLGRIAILKSLILSKLIHLWILLPNPPENFFRELQMQCYEFVWNKKRDKISRQTAHLCVKDGGIGLPNLEILAHSLKLTWLRKLLRTQHNWKSVITLKLNNLDYIEKCGPEVISDFSKSNLFWRDVFYSYKSFFNKTISTNSSELLAEPVFYNKRIQIGGKFIQGKQLVDKGIFCIAHFLRENGSFMSHTEFEAKYNITINFVTYNGYVSTLREYVKKTKVPVRDSNYLQMSKCFKNIMCVIKGCKAYYNTLLAYSTRPKCCAKWEERLEIQPDWKKCFLLASKIKDIKMKWFQLRILHRCIGTNVVLKEMGISNNDLCSFCNIVKDSIQHMFWQCNQVQQFWQTISTLINERCTHASNVRISESLALLGIDKDLQIDSVFYFILLLAKQYIYSCKLENSIPVLHVFIRKLKSRYETEEYIARKTFTHNDFLNKWIPYKPIFN